MLSGAVNLGSPKKNEIDGAYFRRLLRILIPFAFWALVYMSVNPRGSFNPISWADALRILDGRVHYHLWFIYSILGLYIITPVLNAFVMAIGERHSRLVGLLLLCLTGLEWSSGTFAQFTFEPNFVRPLPTYAGYYILGYGLRSLEVTPTIRSCAAMTFLVCAAISLGITGYLNRGGVPFDNRGFHNLNPLVMVMSIAAFLVLKTGDACDGDQRRTVVGRMFAALGRASFGIYLSHVLLLDSILYFGYWENRRVQQSIPVAVVVPLVTILVMLGSWLFTAGLSKVPVLRRLV